VPDLSKSSMPRAAAAVARVRHRATETRFLPIAARPVPDHPGYFQVNRVDRTGGGLPGGWTYLVDLTKRTVVRTSGDPDRIESCRGPPALARNRPPNKGSEQSKRPRQPPSQHRQSRRRATNAPATAARLRPGGEHVDTPQRHRGLARRRLHRDQCARLPAMRRHRHGAPRSGTRQSSTRSGR
jgi:hypothetical protein